MLLGREHSLKYLLLVFCIRQIVNLWFLTFIKIRIIIVVLRKGEAVGDLQAVIHHQPQQDPLHHLNALTFLLVMLDDLQHHLKQTKTQA